MGCINCKSIKEVQVPAHRVPQKLKEGEEKDGSPAASPKPPKTRFKQNQSFSSEFNVTTTPKKERHKDDETITNKSEEQ